MASLTTPQDAVAGSSGSLLPLVRARLVDSDGNDVRDYGQIGELFLRSPSVMKGYLGDDAATRASLTDDGWLRTGDLGVFRLSPKQNAHFFVVDRLKDMIKVKVCC